MGIGYDEVAGYDDRLKVTLWHLLENAKGGNGG